MFELIVQWDKLSITILYSDLSSNYHKLLF
jgi:hypothetical protein